jgi:hypothetical protein
VVMQQRVGRLGADCHLDALHELGVHSVRQTRVHRCPLMSTPVRPSLPAEFSQPA